MITATVEHHFGPGPFTLFVDHDLSEMTDDERIIVAFEDFEALFTVVGKARDSVHFGMFLTPWHYSFWRAQRRKDRWELRSMDRAEILRLGRFYRVSPI